MTIKKDRVIELYKTTLGHITQVCDAANISRTTFYNWLEKDEKFAEAIVNAEASTTDEVKAALLAQIQTGNITAIIFWLKNKSAEFKQDRGANVAVQVNFGDKAAEQREKYGI